MEYRYIFRCQNLEQGVHFVCIAHDQPDDVDRHEVLRDVRRR
jgi:hypothetical protein